MSDCEDRRRRGRRTQVWRSGDVVIGEWGGQTWSDSERWCHGVRAWKIVIEFGLGQLDVQGGHVGYLWWTSWTSWADRLDPRMSRADMLDI